MTSLKTPSIDQSRRLPLGVAAFIGIQAILFGLLTIATAQPVNLVSFDNQAAFDAAAASLPPEVGGPILPFDDLAPPGTPLINGINDFGIISIEVNSAAPNELNFPQAAIHTDGSSGVRGLFLPGFDPTEHMTFHFPEPVFGFFFTIQRHPGPWHSPVSFPELNVNVDGSPAANTSTAGFSTGFYGVLDTGAGSAGTINSFTLSPDFPLSLPEDFFIDDLVFLISDTLPDSEFDLTFTGASAFDATAYDDVDNWERTFEPGVIPFLPPDLNTNILFDSTAGAMTNVSLPLFGAGARTMDVRDQAFTFGANGAPSYPLAIGEIASSGEGVAIGDGGELVCADGCYISVSNSGNSASTVIEAAGTLTVSGGTYETDQLDASAGGSLVLDGGRVVVGAGGFQPADDVVNLGDGEFVLRDGGATTIVSFLGLSSDDPGSLFQVAGPETILTIGQSTGELSMGGNGSFEITKGATVQVREQTGLFFEVSTGRALSVDGGGQLQYTGVGSTVLSFQGPISVSGANSVVDISGSVIGTNTVNVESGGAIAANNLVISGATGRLQGSGQIVGHLQNDGLVAPGSSPGIISVEGDFTQGADGILEIEVGGLTPGTEHDQLQVTGTATLDGHLRVPIINGFVPAVDDEVQFLTADQIDGDFNARSFPGLESADPNLAVELLTEGSDLNGRLRFVEAGDNVLTTQQATTNLMEAASHDNGAPTSTRRQLLSKTIPGPQEVIAEEVPGIPGSANPFVHQLTVEGLTLSLRSTSVVSVTTNVSANNESTVEFDGGILVASHMDVAPTATVIGTGRFIGDLNLGDDKIDGEVATFSPGLPVGNFDVEGNFSQAASGRTIVDVTGTAAGQFDTIAVTGGSQLGGSLTFDASALGPGASGAVLEILTADSFNGTFTHVSTTGSEQYYLRPIYDNGGAGSDESGGSGASFGAVFMAEVCDLGDMNCDGQFDDEDTRAFAIALRDLDAYFDDFFAFTSSGGDLDGWGTPEWQPNGRIDFDDIDDFARLISSGSGASYASILSAIDAYGRVPEPDTGIILMLGVGALFMIDRARFVCS